MFVTFWRCSRPCCSAVIVRGRSSFLLRRFLFLLSLENNVCLLDSPRPRSRRWKQHLLIVCTGTRIFSFVSCLFFFFPILNLRFKVLAACDSFLCVSSLNRYCSVVISARQACLNQSRCMHPRWRSVKIVFLLQVLRTYFLDWAIDRSIDFDTSFPFLSVCNYRTAAASGQIPCKQVSDPILDFRSDPFSDPQDFTSYAPGVTSLFRCIHPPTQRKNCCSSSKAFHRLCRWFSFLSVCNSRAAAAADFQIPCKSLIQSSISAVTHFQIYRISHLRRTILLSALTVNVLYSQIIEPIAIVRALNPTLLSSF